MQFVDCSFFFPLIMDDQGASALLLLSLRKDGSSYAVVHLLCLQLADAHKSYPHSMPFVAQYAQCELQAAEQSGGSDKLIIVLINSCRWVMAAPAAQFRVPRPLLNVATAACSAR